MAPHGSEKKPHLYDRGTGGSCCFYLISPALVDCHVAFQLGAIGKTVAAVGAAEALVGLLVAVLNVLL